MESIRDRLLEAAARVYAETGYRGATTRRIAQEAGVNEITLFRHFGSKTTLILEAVRQANLRGVCPEIPASPNDPVAEIRTWVREQLGHLTQLRSIIRTSLGEIEERPEIIPLVAERPRHVVMALASYLEQLQQQGRASSDFHPRTAAKVFYGSLFAEAMARDVMGEMADDSVDEAARQYSTIFLRAIGVTPDERKGNGRDGASGRAASTARSRRN